MTFTNVFRNTEKLQPSIHSMTRSVLQPIRSRRMTRTVPRSHVNTPDSKVSALTPATRKTLATIGALCVSFAVTASAHASPISSTATPASTQPKMVTVTPVDVNERERDHSRRTDNRETSRGRVVPGSTEIPSKSEAQGVVFLTAGKRPDGTAPRPPMPAPRLEKDDTTAVIAYLMLLSK
jgi:hypothetical protein